MKIDYEDPQKHEFILSCYLTNLTGHDVGDLHCWWCGCPESEHKKE
jgi:hypothetical protein